MKNFIVQELARCVEVQRTLPAVDLSKVRLGGAPFGIERGWAQTASRCPLTARKGDLVMLAEHLRHASAATTLRTYVHLFEKHDDNTRSTLDGVMAARPQRKAQ